MGETFAIFGMEEFILIEDTVHFFSLIMKLVTRDSGVKSLQKE
jgi:hypothetical protein